MSNRDLIQSASATDVGQIRGHNEDSFLNWTPANEEEEQQQGWLFVVADGVGGADAGEVASQFASKRVIEQYLSTDEQDWHGRILQAMHATNTDLRQMVAERDDNSRMATTLVMLVIHDDIATIGNVGDSRAYHWRNGRFEQITQDQTLVAKLVEEGALSPEEAINHPRGNVILYSIGSERKPKIDSYERTLMVGDMLLLCSDGLTKHISDDEIRRMIEDNAPEEATERLIELANIRGGEDNITVTVVRYGESPYLQQHKTTVMAVDRKATPVANGRMGLWLYTVFLTAVMIILMILLQTWLT